LHFIVPPFIIILFTYNIRKLFLFCNSDFDILHVNLIYIKFNKTNIRHCGLAPQSPKRYADFLDKTHYPVRGFQGKPGMTGSFCAALPKLD